MRKILAIDEIDQRIELPLGTGKGRVLQGLVMITPWNFQLAGMVSVAALMPPNDGSSMTAVVTWDHAPTEKASRQNIMTVRGKTMAPRLTHRSALCASARAISSVFRFWHSRATLCNEDRGG